MPFNHLFGAAAVTALLLGWSSQVAAQPQAAGPDAAVAGKASTDAPAQAGHGASAPAPVAGPAAARVVPAGDLIETARASGQFKTFIKAADATNLTGVLKKNPNLTVFAPTDAAFAALPPGELDRLMADKPALQKLMTHHVINARVDSSKIKGAKGPVNTVANDPVELDGSGDVLRAGEANIVQADVMASNGVLHVIDRVLIGGMAARAGVAADAAATTTTSTPATRAATPQ